ncbi:uncharacterized protein LOC133837000 [Drosophila sulfurigaster albostrigata]|uniref:uncharacterized protein LOC133837000 n=1 Tax=Drosophila sulfurigaster albostrigata TaxID=89887 RepID=UPI002D21AD52|nr:uncharacterized protein LOC133837000 [Drosophila sulfurigaster albostrigata]
MSDNNSIVNPNKSLEIPKWINQEYFEAVLQKDEPNCVKIVKFTPVAAIPPGENFTSVMLRIHLDLSMNDGSTKHKTYVVKTMLPEDRGGKQVKEVGIFDKELQMYQKYLPQFEAIYKDAGEEIQLAPKCLQTEERDDGIHFIFEDLGELQFQNVDRIKGLDMEHMKTLLYKLAEFHAVAAVYVERNGPFPKEFDEGFMTRKYQEMQDSAFKLKRESFVKSMAAWGMENSELYTKSFPTAEQFSKMCLRNLELDTQSFNTLTHGDLWSSNLLFKYQADGSIDQMIMLDYQLCKYGSPALDLLFIITISAANDIRLKEFDHFVRIYWERLVDCLKLLKYQKPLPTLRELQKSMYHESNTFYPFFAIFNHLPVIQFPSDEQTSLHSLRDESEEGEKFRWRLFTNPAYAAIMKDLYPFLANRGIFQFTDFE